MRPAHRRTSTRIVILTCVLICSSCASALWADVLESARMLPDDTMILVSVESVTGLRAAVEKTSLYALFKDPAMQEVLRDAPRKASEQIDKGVKDLWQKMKLENPPQQIPYPEGRVVLGASMVAPAVEDANSEPKVRLIALADMGSRASQVAGLLRDLSAGIANMGDTMQKKDIAGVEMNIRVPKQDANEPTICFGAKDGWLVVTVDETHRMDFVESVVRRVGRTVPGNLAEKTTLATAARTLGDAQVFAFVNADAIRSLIVNDAKNKAAVEKMIKGLGFDNVTGVAMAARVAGDRSQDLCTKTLIGIQGPKTGIPALLAASPGPLRLNDRLVTRDIVGFVYANYEIPRFFDEIGKIVARLAPVDLNMMVQAGMVATVGEGGRPPVQFRDEVLAQLAAPVFLITCKTDFSSQEEDRSYFLGAGSKFLVGTSVRDGRLLDGSLDRIHQAFFRSNPKLRREMLNHMIYLLPSGQASVQSADSDSSGPGGDETSTAGGAMAFSVTGDSLVFGSVDQVEQAIRSLQKEPDNGITSDPMFRHARQYLPSQAIVYSYRNHRLYAQEMWKMLGKAARELPDLLRKASGQRDGAPEPVVEMLKNMSEAVDLNRLPEFKTVEKYWGASVGFVQDRPEGIYSESITLKAAPQ